MSHDEKQKMQMLVDRTQAINSGTAKDQAKIREWFEEFEPRFPDKLFEMKDNWGKLEEKKVEESNMDNQYLYGVDFEPTSTTNIEFKKREAKIIYENDEYYYVLFTDKYVLPVQKSDVVMDSGNFKEIYYQEKNTRYFPSNRALFRTLFLNEELRDEFYEACKKYYKIWDKQEDISLAKKRLATSEENTRKEKEYLERLNKELITLKSDM